ncbi:sporulation-delaying protein SdpB family protein [Oceanobacillus kimchii]|uniref:HTTM-like domain-containing protein n=1 Tax=Oceanobacillus kimchii TaxID=746691 RepID=A0ABQ5TLY2_9BACI|nr:sporulation-delaying protein SdpB family protein [Oceanobacillus kimchii]GLO66115.1 hypothetical protein MACH08_18990 [Oceanobacillus kimchii]
MFKNLNHRILKWANENNPWTNVYGLARTLIALSTLLTLALNDAEIFFRPTSDTTVYPNCSNSSISIFCLVPPDYTYLNIVRWICVLILIVVASGWRPRFTGIFHWWVSFSLLSSGVTIDGGENVAAVLTFLLIPMTLSDPRKNHWEKIELKENEGIYRRITALINIVFIRIQVAIIYFHSTVAKLNVPEWIDGTAVWYYIQSPMLGFNDFLNSLFNFATSSKLILIPTWGTLILQTILFMALFAPKKYWKYFLMAAIFMHEIFALLLGLVSFSLIMLGALVLYLRPIEEPFKFKRLKKPVSKKELKEVV